MDQKAIYDKLRAASFSRLMSDQECQVLSSIPSAKTLSNDEVLLQEGASGESFYIIVDGMLAVTKDTGSGEWVTLHLLRVDDLAGEMGFINGTPHSATLRAVGESTVLAFPREKLEAILEAHPWVVYRTMQAVMQSAHDTLCRMNTQYVEMSNYISKQHGRY